MNDKTEQAVTDEPRGTAAGGHAEIINVPGYLLMVRAVDYNTLRAQLAEAQRNAATPTPDVEPPWGEGSSATVHAWSKGFHGDDPCERFALAAYRMADAMLAERMKGEPS